MYKLPNQLVPTVSGGMSIDKSQTMDRWSTKVAPAPMPQIVPKVKVVESMEEWETAVSAARVRKVCCLDTETTGIDPLASRIRIIQMGIPAEPAYPVYIADLKTLGHECVAEIIRLLEDEQVLKIFQNAKFDLAFFRQSAKRRIAANNIFDTMVASQLVTAGNFEPEWDEEKGKIKAKAFRHGLDQLAMRHFGIKLDKSWQMASWTDVLSKEQLQYAAMDAAVLYPLYKVLQELIVRNKLEQAANLEFRVIPAIVEIELSGLPFKAPQARQQLTEIKEELARLQKHLQQEAAEIGFKPRKSKAGAQGFNPNSVKDLTVFLRFLGHSIRDTSEETIMDLAVKGCKTAEALLQYRGAQKKAAFLEEWLEAQHPADDRIHSQIRQLNDKCTGRFSMSQPNLQQIPRDKALRALFEAPNGKRLVTADYSAIELRIMAYLSNDVSMCQAFLEGKDLHRVTAAAVSGKNIAEIAKDSPERQGAKAINFGLIYGCGPERLALSAKYQYGVDMSLSQAIIARNKFFARYMGVKHFLRTHCNPKTKKTYYSYHSAASGFQAVSLVGTRSLSGRLRVWPYFRGKSLATFTMLANTPDQGTGADIIKQAMTRVYAELLRRQWDAVRMVATIHDELILEAPEDMAEAAFELLTTEMVKAGETYIAPIPAEVEGTIAHSLAEK